MSSISRARRAAVEFMRHKGYGDVAPKMVEEVDDEDIWYFFYDLEEGTLELEVAWDGAKWFWEVMDFVHYEDQDESETLAGFVR